MNMLSEFPGLQRASSLVRFQKPREGGLFNLSRVAGRLVEVSESGFHGLLSALAGLLWEAQQTGQVTAWVKVGPTVFFPPDFISRGLDLDAVVVVACPSLNTGLQASERLLRSAAFGVVVIDGVSGTIEDSSLGRLSKLAEESDTAVVITTCKEPSAPSLGSMISLRGCVSLLATGELETRILRDKHSGPLSVQRSSYHGPLGLY